MKTETAQPARSVEVKNICGLRNQKVLQPVFTVIWETK